MLSDLATLTPSVLVAAGFLLGVFVLLRHEMAPRRRSREDAGPAADLSTDDSISDDEDAGVTSSPGDEEVADPPGGRRSPG